jgi:TDG/mug DNA glycosylase family protein
VILPDVLAPNLKVVFCGTQAGERSASVGAYYAGRGNRFYDTLFRTGLTPRKLEPLEFPALLTYGIGLTDIAKQTSGADRLLRPEHFDSSGLIRKIEQHKPRLLAFNGKRAAQAFYGRNVVYGAQPESIGDTRVYVLPSTSGAARGFWDERYWFEMAAWVKG